MLLNLQSCLEIIFVTNISAAIFHMKIQKIFYNFSTKSVFPNFQKNQISDPEFFGQNGPAVPELLRDTQTVDIHTDKKPYYFVYKNLQIFM